MITLIIFKKLGEIKNSGSKISMALARRGAWSFWNFIGAAEGFRTLLWALAFQAHPCDIWSDEIKCTALLKLKRKRSRSPKFPICLWTHLSPLLQKIWRELIFSEKTLNMLRVNARKVGVGWYDASWLFARLYKVNNWFTNNSKIPNPVYYLTNFFEILLSIVAYNL